MAETLTHRTVKNSIYAIIGFVWPLLLSFVAAPIIIRDLGPAKFGFYSLLNTVLILFSLLDFGIDYNFVKRLSENREHPGGEELSVIFSTTTILYALLGAVALLSLMLFQGVFRQIFKIPVGFISSFTLAFFILGAAFLIKVLTISLLQIPFALQRQDISVKINLVGNTLLEVGSVLAIKTGHGILSLLVVQLIAAAFTFLSFYFVWHYLAPDLKFVLQLSKKAVRAIGRQGFWIFWSNTMGNIVAQFDKFVLGAIWGPGAVGYYSTAQMIPEKISGTSFSLSQIFFPIFSEASSREEDGTGRVKDIFRRAMGIIPVITAGLALLVLLYGYQLVRYWISKDFADHTVLAVPLLAVTYFLLSFNSFFQFFLSGLKKLKFLALSAMVIAAADVVFMFILIPRYSVNGAAWAYLISGVPVLGFLYYIERSYFASTKREFTQFYGKLFGKILLVSALTFAFGYWFVRPFIHNLALTMVLGGSTSLVYIGLFWILGFLHTDDERLLRQYLKRVGQVFKKPKLG